jgi:transposase
LAGVRVPHSIVDNRKAHRVVNLLLFGLEGPRWEFVFQPKYAGELNLVESWRKMLKPLAPKRTAVRDLGGRLRDRRDGNGLLQ